MSAVCRIVAVAVFFYACFASAYEIETHAKVSEAAFDQSGLHDGPLLTDLGLKSSDSFPDSQDPEPKTIRELVSEGSQFEDGFSCLETRPRHHFFDPLTGEGLHWTVQLFFGPGLIDVAGNPSPDWALEDKRDFGNEQRYSFKHAREYFYDALTATTPAARDTNFGLTFQTLGHVIHHIEDMAQPQHVRNDVHYASPPDCGIATYLLKLIRESPSRYEAYTNQVRDHLFGANSQLPVYKPVNDPDDVASLTTARAFWHTENGNPLAGKGIAEFTNANFVSYGTDFRGVFANGRFKATPNERYPLPAPEPATPVYRDANALLQSIGGAAPPACAPPNNPCVMAFFSSQVTDNYRPTASRVNSEASTASIFDQDLQVSGLFVPYPNLDKCTDPINPATCEQIFTNAVFALNRFNFDAAQAFLIPRAVAYSAGLINYFFRGRLEAAGASFSDDGATLSVSLNVKNAIDPATPAWKDENLVAVGADRSSTFVLTARYQEAGQDKFIASSPVVLDPSQDPVITPGETSKQSLTFTLPAIPADATKVEFRLVFRGKLGQEEDAVAVGRVKPVSGFALTPNYFPADGIGGTRAIFKRGDAWVLDTQPDVLAGNIDWKGAYIGDQPTKVLSWKGPRGRYFGTSNDRLGVEIYQHGRLWAVTPGLVLGAAITKDASGQEWLIAICQDGSTDVVYRRPNTESTSAALYDPVAAPEGWQQIANFTQDPTLYFPADSPWFFNGDGTEAQTMRAVKSNIPNQLHRLKITIANAVSANLVNLGNLAGYTSQSSIVCSDKNSGSGSETTMGDYVVAVDYLNMTELLAKISVAGMSAGTFAGPNPYSQTAESSFTATLSIGNGAPFTFFTEHRTASEAAQDGRFHRTETFDGHEPSIFAMDLRYGLVALQGPDLENQHVEIEVVNNGGTVVGTRTESFAGSRVRAAVSSNLGPEVEVFSHADTPTTTTNVFNFFPVTLDCIPRASEATGYIRFFDPTVFEGVWLVDSGGNLFGSELYTDSFHNSGGAFSYVSDGDLNQIIPPGSDAAVYTPAGVIR
jgi:hypothetical protein